MDLYTILAGIIFTLHDQGLGWVLSIKTIMPVVCSLVLGGGGSGPNVDYT
jgi:hypothetical protein